MSSDEKCAECGNAIPVGEAEFDLSYGRIGLPYHPSCFAAVKGTSP